jgi:hypothetical protein
VDERAANNYRVGETTEAQQQHEDSDVWFATVNPPYGNLEAAMCRARVTLQR